jgi:hypothetical protein
MNTPERQKVASKILGLMQKTVDNGCSEQEALSAAEMVKKLRIQYDMTMTNVELLADPVHEFSFDRNDEMNFLPEDFCIEGISALCGVKIWHTKRAEKALFTNEIHNVRLLTILGTEQDVRYAHWLYEMIATTIESAFTAYRNTLLYKRNPNPIEAGSSFKMGMSVRINVRLLELSNVDFGGQSATGTDLVVIKAEKLSAAMAARNYSFNAVEVRNKATDERARRAGMAAGDDVNLSRPLEGRKPRVRLNG